MDPHLQSLADVLVELVVRELQNEKSRRSPDKERGGFGDFEHENHTATGAPAP